MKITLSFWHSLKIPSLVLYLLIFICFIAHLKDPTPSRAWCQCSGIATCLWVWWVGIAEAPKPQRSLGKFEKCYDLHFLIRCPIIALYFILVYFSHKNTSLYTILFQFHNRPVMMHSVYDIYTSHCQGWIIIIMLSYMSLFILHMECQTVI